MKSLKIIILLIFLISCSKEKKNMIYCSLQDDSKLIIKGDSIEKEFYFINYSDSSISILDHRVSCGCSLISLKPNMKILSGDSLKSNIKIRRIGNEKKGTVKDLLISLKFDRFPYLKTYKIRALY